MNPRYNLTVVDMKSDDIVHTGKGLMSDEIMRAAGGYDTEYYIINVSVVGQCYHASTVDHCDTHDGDNGLTKVMNSLARQVRGIPTRETWLAVINNMTDDELAELYIQGDIELLFNKLPPN